jgi:hypothetical protein
MQFFCSSVGPELDAQVPAPHPSGEAEGRLEQRAHSRPGAGGLQDVHLPRVHLHGRDRVSEPAGESARRLIPTIILLAP